MNTIELFDDGSSITTAPDGSRTVFGRVAHAVFLFRLRVEFAAEAQQFETTLTKTKS